MTIKHSIETQYNSFTNFLTANLLLISYGLKKLQIKTRLRSKSILPIYQALLSQFTQAYLKIYCTSFTELRLKITPF